MSCLLFTEFRYCAAGLYCKATKPSVGHRNFAGQGIDPGTVGHREKEQTQKPDPDWIFAMALRGQGCSQFL